MIKHVSVFTLKDKSEIKHFVEMLEEVGKNYPLIIKSEIGLYVNNQLYYTSFVMLFKLLYLKMRII